MCQPQNEKYLLFLPTEIIFVNHMYFVELGKVNTNYKMQGNT